ncbi:MAG: hypothetical protein H6Q99_2233 [Proteobacteria bacterium]|nr:hypothetical protein [Pseudomonadota bacterium]
MDWHVTIIGVISLDVFLFLLGAYLYVAASSEIEKHMPLEFSRGGTYRWYVQYFAFDAQVCKKYRCMYMVSIYVIHLAIFMFSMTLFLFDQTAPAVIFLLMSLGSVFGLVKYTKEFLASMASERPSKM